MEDEEDCSIPDYKLCGFLITALTINHDRQSQANDFSVNLPFGTQLHVTGAGSDVYFRSDNGVVLSPIISESEEECKGGRDGNGKGIESAGGGSSSIRKRRVNGLVHGRLSVVHQLHALVTNKCIQIVSRSIGSEVCRGALFEEVRVVVLVDVYLRIALWSGWQFPRSGSIAGSLFKHLSCDWARRTSMLVSNYASEDKSIWTLSDCHVLGCKMQCGVLHSSKKTQFDLHEIFKSLPSVGNEGPHDYSTMTPADDSLRSGFWDVSGDVLINILTLLSPTELLRVSATCRRLRSLAASIVPCMKLKLFPHQQGAVEWMLQRERNSEVLPHPLYMNFVTKDGFDFYISTISGEIVTGMAPIVKDFNGGMFCDEPGLGKTITALSLILKTQGTLAEPPEGVPVVWRGHNGNQRRGYYELNAENVITGDIFAKKFVSKKIRRGQVLFDGIATDDISYSTPKRTRLMGPVEQIEGSHIYSHTYSSEGTPPSTSGQSVLPTCALRRTRNSSQAKRNLRYTLEEASNISAPRAKSESPSGRKQSSNAAKKVSFDMVVRVSDGSSYDIMEEKMACVSHFEENETWAQCDSCRKWRKLAHSSVAEVAGAWFCSMNANLLYQSCHDPEEAWDAQQSITGFPGFHTKGTSGGREENVAFFTSVLKENYDLLNFETRKALTWLATLPFEKLSQMETTGLTRPVLNARLVSNGGISGYHKIFQAFGLIKRVEKGVSKWYYPLSLNKFVFDLAALRKALCEPLDSLRLYLSTATLIIVPANLVDHWATQIHKHVRPGQLQVYVWTGNQKPCAHNLAWDYDVVITTFNRLSAEWGPRKKSALMQVHWRRVMLDEGHTLGSSLSLTNKLQMAISLTASNRWLLTGTPTPNTPNSQLSNLQPMLRFLHDEVYGQNQKSWEAGILRPFEAEMEEGRLLLLQLLCRCMISARKIDLKNIPPCIKKVKFLDFTEEHAKSYNELVVTVQRNILMADWNDPSHVESLLNPKQWKFRTTTIKNVRLSCCVAGHIKVTDAGEDIQETMDILVENGLDPLSEEYSFIRYNILNGGSCMRCKEWCRLPVITPCRHLLCLDCVALDSETCTFPGCANLYEMQTPDTLTRPENPNPKWPVPKDLIELQPSYKQDDWDPDWQSTSSSKVSYLVQRLTVLQEANRELGYPIDEIIEAEHVKELHSSHEIVNFSEFLHPVNSKPGNKSFKPPPDKVLIFSQFLEHIHVIEQQLTLAGIKFTGMYSPMHASNKMKSLAIFQHDASCMALLMDGSAALGLDLSFVTYVFLMEPIWDRSMEEQVISRAHRMGATRPVHVETLAMHGTIEEQMVGFLQDADECKRFLNKESVKPDHNEPGGRPHRNLHDFAESNYLSHLSFVRKNKMA